VKLGDVIKAIDEEAIETVKTEFRNVFATDLPDSEKDQQLALGFDRVKAFHARAIAMANVKFKEAS